MIAISIVQLSWMRPSKINRELEYLKAIELEGYYGRTSDAELLMYFLENAVALEKIIVHPHPYVPFRFPYKMKPSQKAAISRGLKQLEQLIPQNVQLVIL